MATIKGTSGRDFIHKAGDGLTAPKGYKNKLGVTNKDDTLTGLGGNDMLFGGKGNDVLDGGTGADRMNGGKGNDTYVVDNAKDRVAERAKGGTDLVQASLTYVLGKEIENLTLTGTAAINGTGNTLANILIGNSAANQLFGREGDDRLDGGEGADTLDGGTGADTLDGGTGADTMNGGAGDDVYIVGEAGDTITEAANGGDDLVRSEVTFSLGAEIERLELTGTAAINGTGNAAGNILTGNSAANQLIGLAGDDTLNGGAGADTMDGGDGNDTYVVDDAGDGVTEAANGGNDLVKASVSFTLGAEIERLELTGTAAIHGTGNGLANKLIGNSAANVLDGGAGADEMSGGAGDDGYRVDDVGDVIIEAQNGGTDTVEASVDTTLDNDVENLNLVGAAVIGTGNALDNAISGNSLLNSKLYGLAGNDTIDAGEGGDELYGGEGADVLNGWGGQDRLDGGMGADTMAGGDGSDYYLVDDASDIVIEQAGGGVKDQVSSTVSYTLSLNVETLELTGSADIKATGNSQNNTLTGNSGNNELDGGAGADKMDGLAGNDTYVVDDLGDVVTEAANGGDDLVKSAVTFTLGSDIERLELTGTAAINGTGNAASNILTGNSAANQLIGLAGDDTLSGGAGADTMDGGDGNDTYVVDDAGDVVTEAANGGDDLVKASVSFTLDAEIEQLELTGTEHITGTGNSLDNVLYGNSGMNTLKGGSGYDVIYGGDGDDTLFGEGEGDAIYGGMGNDQIDGGSGNNEIYGGEGDDTYTISSNLDYVEEYAGEGIDEVFASIDFILSAHVENLTLTSLAIKATGNSQANRITGNSAANILDGGDGADELSGLGGNDTYIIDDVGDVVTELTNGGNDLVQTSITYTLALNVERLELTGTDDINGTGNTQSNILKGNSGKNVLSGDEGDDQLYGDDGIDQLSGGDGFDLLFGGAGDDIYYLSDANDDVSEDANGGNDTVLSFVDYILPANVEDLTLQGSATSGTGNPLANKLTAGGNQNSALIGLDGDDTLIGDGFMNNLFGGSGQDNLTGGGGLDRFFFQVAEATAFDRISDFVSGVDRLVFDMSDLSIGDGDTVVDSFTATSLNWSGAQEIVVYTTAINNLSASTVAAILPDAINAVSMGNRQLICVHNNADAALFLFVSDGDADVETAELTKIAELDNITSLGASDFQFFA